MRNRLLAFFVLAATATAQIKIAVNATTIESAPIFLAERMPGVQIVPVPNGRVAMEQLLHGNVDAATGSETQMLLNSIAEPGIRIILTLAEARYRIIARRSAGIRRVEDLRGKKVGATVNTSAQYFLREMLRKAGLRLDADVRFVNLEGPDMPAALKRGDVDAVAIWEPHAQNSLEALGSDAMVLENSSVYRERFNLNTTTKVLQDPDKRRALVDFLRAILRASDRARSHASETQTQLAPFINTPAATIARVWNQYRFPANLAGDLPEVLGNVEIFVAAVQYRGFRARASLATFIDPSVLTAAKQ
jgi:sulfonate transport system substrate-binding protein